VKKDETCGLWLVQTSQTKTPHNQAHVKKGETCSLSCPAKSANISNQTTTKPTTCEKR
jgi:hypothetical protein